MKSIIEKAVETIRGACRKGSLQTDTEIEAVFVVAAHTLQQDKVIVALERRIAELESNKSLH